jgi:ATP-dependent DNA ligase
MYLNGENLMEKCLKERKEILSQFYPSENLNLVDYHLVEENTNIQTILSTAL